MNKLVVGIGEILWDILPDEKQLGGAPANFAYHASQLGVDGRAVSAIGNDDLGDEIVRTLDERSLGYDLERVPYATGQVAVNPDTDPGTGEGGAGPSQGTGTPSETPSGTTPESRPTAAASAAPWPCWGTCR